jgi:hypothetical protein
MAPSGWAIALLLAAVAGLGWNVHWQLAALTPSSWALLSVSIWLSYATARGWTLTLQDKRQLLWALGSALALLNLVISDPEFQVRGISPCRSAGGACTRSQAAGGAGVSARDAAPLLLHFDVRPWHVPHAFNPQPLARGIAT